MPFPALGSRRAIIDRRAISDRINTLAQEHRGDPMRLRGLIVKELKTALDHGRDDVARRLAAKPTRGREAVSAFAFLIDQLIRVIHDHATTHLYSSATRSQAERLAVMAVGGYGRAEMSPHSDVDIAFLVPVKDTPWCEQAVEAALRFAACRNRKGAAEERGNSLRTRPLSRKRVGIRHHAAPPR